MLPANGVTPVSESGTNNRRTMMAAGAVVIVLAGGLGAYFVRGRKAAAPAIAVNPNTAAMIATMKKVSAHDSMTDSSSCFDSGSVHLQSRQNAVNCGQGTRQQDAGSAGHRAAGGGTLFQQGSRLHKQPTRHLQR